MTDTLKTKDHGKDILSRTRDLICDMVAELRLRGCQDGHSLIQRAADLIDQLNTMDKNLAPCSEAFKAVPKGSKRLYQMSAETVSSMQLADPDSSQADLFSQKDLAEAAFTFENELIGLLGDDNAMAIDAYEGLSEKKLLAIIASAVEKICRLRTN